MFPRRHELWRFPLVIILSVWLGSCVGGCLSARVWHLTGTSMLPSFTSSEWLVLWDNDETPDRGDVCIIKAPLRDDGVKCWVKRIVGLPGEHIFIEAGTDHVWVNNTLLFEPYLPPGVVYEPGYSGEWDLGPDEFFLMGDNRNVSFDSRYVGPIKRADIIAILGVYWRL